MKINVWTHLRLLIKQTISIWVYSDIIEFLSVGDIQAAILGYVPIKSMFDEMKNWNCNLPYYINV